MKRVVCHVSASEANGVSCLRVSEEWCVMCLECVSKKWYDVSEISIGEKRGMSHVGDQCRLKEWSVMCLNVLEKSYGMCLR